MNEIKQYGVCRLGKYDGDLGTAIDGLTCHIHVQRDGIMPDIHIGLQGIQLPARRKVADVFVLGLGRETGYNTKDQPRDDREGLTRISDVIVSSLNICLWWNIDR